ncbi:MAG: hypothetical protein K6L74_04795 [Neptuniibacter sp.]
MMSLRYHVNIRILCIFIVILVTGGFIAIREAKKSVIEEVSSSFNLVKTILDSSISKETLPYQDKVHWPSLISKLNESRHIEIELLNSKRIQNEEANLIFNGNTSPPIWFVNTITTDFPTLKHNIKTHGDTINYIEISADPVDEIEETWKEFQTLVWSILVILTTVFIVINAVFNYTFKAVKSIIFSLNNITTGEYEQQLPRYKISELDAIAMSINTLIEALKEAHKQNNELRYHSLQVQENERKSISQELHDEMGQSIAAIRAVAYATKKSHSGTYVASNTIIDTCDHLSNIVSSRMQSLHPLSLNDLGLGETIKTLINDWRKNNPEIKVIFSYEKSIDKLKKEKLIHFYRIIQEALNNISKHSSASETTISLAFFKDSEVLIEIEDNGIGLPNENYNTSFGLRGMKERSKSQGGKFSITSKHNKGVNIKAIIPAF